MRERLEERIGMPLSEVKPDEYTQVMIERAAVLVEEERVGMPVRLMWMRRRRSMTKR